MLYDRPVGEVFDIQFEPTHEAASRTRRQARDHLDGSGLPADVAADAELVISELLANAVDQEPTLPVRLDVVIVEGAIYLAVANSSTGAPLCETAPGCGDNAHLAECGRGLAIVRALTDEIWVNSDTEWTSVSCLRLLD